VFNPKSLGPDGKVRVWDKFAINTRKKDEKGNDIYEGGYVRKLPIDAKAMIQNGCGCEKDPGEKKEKAETKTDSEPEKKAFKFNKVKVDVLRELAKVQGISHEQTKKELVKAFEEAEYEPTEEELKDAEESVEVDDD